MYALDTNAIIYYLQDDPSAVSFFSDVLRKNLPFCISAITEVELFGFPNLTDREAEQIDAALRTIAVIPVDSRIARIAGQIRKLYRINVADSVIAATALFTGSTLVTRNVADFRKIPHLVTHRI